MFYSGDNLAIYVLRFLLAFFVVFVLWPNVLFVNRDQDPLDRFFAGFARAVLLLIAAGYILVILKLYEFITLILLLLLFSLRGVLSRYGSTVKAGDLKTLLATGFYDFLDGLTQPGKQVAYMVKKTLESFENLVRYNFRGAAVALGTILLLLVFLQAAYLRFYDSLNHAAPAMSDAYVTLAWLKYIEARILFNDGIYPQGFHIYLSVLHKFSGADALIALKYGGPFNSLLTMLSLYFFVSRLSGRRPPGIIAAFVYGSLSSLLPLDWERQASTNSQEFALVFLFPAWYYTLTYLRNKRRQDLWSAAACYAVIGLVHSLVFAFLCLGLFIMLLVQLILNIKSAVAVLNVCLASASSVVLAVLPAVAGLLMGMDFHASSAGYVTRIMKVENITTLSTLDMVAASGIVLAFLAAVLIKRKPGAIVPEAFFLMLGCTSLAMYVYLGYLSGSEMLVFRTGLLWGLIAAAGTGLGWNALTWVLHKGGTRRLISVFLCAAAVTGTLYYVKPVPAAPYKMQYDSEVDQYLRIINEYRPSEWLMVSMVEGYSLSLGTGWHINVADFLEYSPLTPKPSRESGGQREELDHADIFIFQQKKMFEIDEKIREDMKEILERRSKEYPELEAWVEKFSTVHDNMSVYYEDDNLRIMRIHQSKTQKGKFETIWGTGK